MVARHRRTPALALALLAACGGAPPDREWAGSNESGNGSPDENVLGQIDGVDAPDSSAGVQCTGATCEVEVIAQVGALKSAVLAQGWIYYTEGYGISRVALDGGSSTLVHSFAHSDLVGGDRGLFSIAGLSGHTYVVQIEANSGTWEATEATAETALARTDDALFSSGPDGHIYRLPFDGTAGFPINCCGADQIVASRSWVCFRDTTTVCGSAFGNSGTFRVDDARWLVDLDDSHLYYVDEAGNLRRISMSERAVQTVLEGGPGRNESYAQADGSRLYWNHFEGGVRRIISLTKATGVIEHFATLESGKIVGGNDDFLLVDEPLRRIRK
ncbi:MAG: hypothetical protein RMA76_08500 [Deltaproteobacteria bacterium]|jgi:hypothetical protein